MASRWVPQLTFKAIDPNNLGKHWKVGVPPWLLQTHQKYGHEKEMGRLILVITGGGNRVTTMAPQTK